MTLLEPLRRDAERIGKALGRGAVKVGPLTLKIKYDSQWGEYIVQWIESGKINDRKSYHTADRADAILTLADMAREARAKGYSVTTVP